MCSRLTLSGQWLRLFSTVVRAAPLLLGVAIPASAATVLWSSTSGSAWLTGTNWTGSAVAGAADIAQFGANPTSATTGIGLNFNSTTNAGTQTNGLRIQEVGAIEITSSRSTNLHVGNSASTSGASGTLRLNGVTVNSTANVIIRHAGSGNLTIQNTQGSGNQTMAVAINNATDNVILVDGAGSVIISSIIKDGGTGNHLTLSGSGTGALTLSGANTFTGGFTLSSGATVNLNHAAALGTGTFSIAGGSINNTTGSALTLTSNNSQAWNGDFTFTGTSNLHLGTGAVTLGATRSITITSGILTVGGTIGDAGHGYGLTKAGAGVLLLSGTNTFTGPITINNGTLRLGTSAVIADTANVIVNALTGGTTATLDLNDFSDTIGALTFGGTGATATSTNVVQTSAGTLTLGGDVSYIATNHPLGATLSGNIALGASRTFNIGDSSNAATDLTVSAAISGAGFSVTKSGAGTLAFTGANTYSGGTAISAGTLTAGHNSALGSGSAVIASGAVLSISSGITLGVPISIASGGTLAGTGTAAVSSTISGNGVITGSLTIASGGSIAPGASAGTLTIASGGTLTFAAGSIYAWTLSSLTTSGAGTNFDLISLSGTASLTTNGVFLVPSFSTGQSPANGNSFWNTAQSWTVVSGSGTSTITGTFQVDNSGWSNGVFATAISGGNVVLNWTPSAVPEPSTYALFAGIAVLGSAVWRRRKKAAPTTAEVAL